MLATFPGCAATTTRELAAGMVASTVALATEDGTVFCSGVAIAPNRIMTAAHCLNAASQIYVFSESDRTLRLIAVVWADVERDVTVADVAGAQYSPARLGDSSKLARGDRVFNVGNTYGVLEFSFYAGVVSHVVRTLTDIQGAFIQYQLETRGGNSGGPVFNEAGEVVAIHVRSDNAGIAFGVPINEAKR
jgi:serine protease Do